MVEWFVSWVKIFLSSLICKLWRMAMIYFYFIKVFWYLKARLDKGFVFFIKGDVVNG